MLLGVGSNDDSGIFKLNEELALVQTIDFITPVVDDPYLFGQIAAANSLSDVWAMGGKVVSVLNMVAYDNCHLTLEHLKEILNGGADKVKEAGGVVLGGHTIEDQEMKYGMCVTGTIHPDLFVRNNTSMVGDLLILTKPLGIGVITTSIKGEMADEETIKTVAEQMVFLNKYASELAMEHGVHAMTDVTGFGLFGHLNEMTNDDTSIILYDHEIPIMKAAHQLAALGMFPAGAYNNETYYEEQCKIEIDIIDSDRMLYFDPQTSGGLLISLPEKKAVILLKELHEKGIEQARIIGEVIKKDDYNVYLRK